MATLCITRSACGNAALALGLGRVRHQLSVELCFALSVLIVSDTDLSLIGFCLAHIGLLVLSVRYQAVRTLLVRESSCPNDGQVLPMILKTRVLHAVPMSTIPSPRCLRILITDDDPSILEMLSSRLEILFEHEAEIETVSSAEEALERLYVGPIDLLLTDYDFSQSDHDNPMNGLDC